MITGGTGFIGYHCAIALLEAGHEVTLLVRSVEKMRGMYGQRIEHYVVGDIADKAAVDQSLEGCDAVIHGAAMVSTSAKDAQRVYDTNVTGTRLVVGGAVARGIRSIIHVSSITALYDPGAESLNENSPVGTAENAYGRSKVASEIFVRDLQAKGAPVTITYPATVIGPESPTLTEPHEGLALYMGRVIPRCTSGTQFVDVRDVALAHRQLLERPPQERLPQERLPQERLPQETDATDRFPIGGHYIPWADLIDRTEQLTGISKLVFPMPAFLLRLLGRIADVLKHFVTIQIPLSHEGAVYATNWKKLDNHKLESTLNFRFRDLDGSLVETMRWLVEAGHVKPERLGKLGAPQESLATGAEPVSEA